MVKILDCLELAREYGALGGNTSIDFSQITDADALFADGVERNEPEVGSKLLAQRATKALEWLSRLPEHQQSVAVVSHKHFLGAVTALHPDGVAQRPFQNAERRSVLLCVRGGDGDGNDGGSSTLKTTSARVKPMGEAQQT